MLVERVADLIARHAVVGWFQGRAEIGPRALGARSVLGNPTRRSNLVRINHLKGREVWRPLAPSITEEAFSRYFDGPPAPRFMLVACRVRDDKVRRLRAVVHVDGSVRPQAVSKTTQPRYWRLLDALERRTGDPVLVNTSFNVAGEPIVNTPQEAIADLLSTDLDALAIGDHLVVKPGAGTTPP